MKISVRLSPFLALPMSVRRPVFWDLAAFSLKYTTVFLNLHMNHFSVSPSFLIYDWDHAGHTGGPQCRTDSTERAGPHA